MTADPFTLEISREPESAVAKRNRVLQKLAVTSSPRAIAGMDVAKKTKAKAKKSRGKKDNTGYWPDRVAFNEIERAMAEQWSVENEERPGLNYGHGILQDLMLSTHWNEKPEGFDPWLSDRERKIVAMVIQWLGTNVGRSFLHEANTSRTTANF